MATKITLQQFVTKLKRYDQGALQDIEPETAMELLSHFLSRNHTEVVNLCPGVYEKKSAAITASGGELTLPTDLSFDFPFIVKCGDGLYREALASDEFNRVGRTLEIADGDYYIEYIKEPSEYSLADYKNKDDFDESESLKVMNMAIRGVQELFYPTIDDNDPSSAANNANAQERAFYS